MHQEKNNSQRIFEYLQGRFGKHLKLLMLPYKRDMWDSFEGIYRIANSTPGCSADVMPIPYTLKGMPENARKWFMDDFNDVCSRDIVDYQKRPKKGEYDVILIHNPYDNENYVTSVHPAFYSDRLKGLSRALCLVPYGIGLICLITPGVFNCDIVFAENDQIVKSFRAQMKKEGVTDEELDVICRKFIVIGSPKHDLNLNQHVPEEWLPRIHDRKVVLLATSLQAFLNDPAGEMAKIGNIITEITRDPNTILIWREHPLMMPTILTMRPQYVEEYGRFRKNFEEQKIGIIDKTRDYRIAFSVADVLYSDPSSLVEVWKDTGKEMYVI